VKPEDAEEYTQALGQVVAGGWRQIALAQRLGVPKALKLSVDDWVKQRLGGYVKYSVEERQHAVKTLAAEGHSEREIAKVTGVDRYTVREDLGKPRGGNSTTYPKKREKENDRGGGVSTTDEPLDLLTTLAATDAVLHETDSRTARADRVAKRHDTAEKLRQRVELPDAKFRVIYADPPWSYNDKADAGSVQSGGAEQHYPSMTLDELCAMKVAEICEPNAVLFLWTTSPLLEDAFAVIRSWGFTYKSSFVWDKHAHNRGHYNSVRHEFLLLAVRGSCPPDVPKLFDSVQKTGRTDHSEKPGVFRIIIETLYPHGKRLELFHRGEPIEGWAAWGNEAAV
jgi:N6-adenosine-specific RNA methylase IME4